MGRSRQLEEEAGPGGAVALPYDVLVCLNVSDLHILAGGGSEDETIEATCVPRCPAPNLAADDP